MQNYLTTREAATILHVSASRVRQLILEGRLRTNRAGQLHLIDPADLEPVRVRVRTGRPRKNQKK